MSLIASASFPLHFLRASTQQSKFSTPTFSAMSMALRKRSSQEICILSSFSMTFTSTESSQPKLLPLGPLKLRQIFLMSKPAARLSFLRGLNCEVISIGMSNLRVYIPLTSQWIGIPFRTMPCRAAFCLGLVTSEQPCFHGHLVWLRISIGTNVIQPI